MNKPKSNQGTHASARELPHSPELERAVLAVLLDGRSAVSMQTTRAMVPHPLVFFARDHRMVFLACLEIDDAGNRVDAQSVIEQLSRYPFQTMLERLHSQQILFESDQLDGLDRRRLREIYRLSPEDKVRDFADSALTALGGPNAVFDIMQAFGPAAGLVRNVQLLRDYYLKRRMITRLQSLCDKAYLTTDEFPQLLDQSNQAVLELNKLNQMATLHAIGDVVDQTLLRITEQDANPEQAVRTGFADLDHMLSSLRPGGLYVLAARPGVGKTSLALKMVTSIAGNPDPTHQHGVLFFSLEVDRVDLLKKLLAAESGVPFSQLDNGQIGTDEMAQVETAGNRCKSWKLHLMDVADLTVHALRSVVKRHHLESGGQCRLVVLDYLQLLKSSRNDASEYERISEISRILKLMAMELKLPVLALSQMSRDSEKGASNQPRDPRLSDLRGSGSIEQDADAVLFIHRTDGGEGSEDQVRRLKIIVAKNRFGRTGFMPLDFYPEKLRFEKAHLEEEGDHLDEGTAGVRAHQRRQNKRRSDQPAEHEDQFRSDQDSEQQAPETRIF